MMRPHIIGNTAPHRRARRPHITGNIIGNMIGNKAP
jgi:hypothetical protein